MTHYHIKQLYPDVLYLGVADGAPDNWTFLNPHTQRQVTDFWHASEYLAEAAEALYPGKKEKNQKKQWLDERCHKLKHLKGAAGRILKELKGAMATLPKRSQGRFYKPEKSYELLYAGCASLTDWLRRDRSGLQDDCKTTAVPIGDEVEQKRGFNYFKPENLGAIESMGAILGENKPVWCGLLVFTSCCSYTSPKHPLGKAIASPALLAHLIIGKYCDGLPLYRQEVF